MNVTATTEIMKSDYLHDSRIKNEGRQYLQRRRMTKPVSYKNGDFDSDLAFAMQESLQMAREKENEVNNSNNFGITNGGVLDEIPVAKMAGRTNNSGDAGRQENKELRELLLLHVDLIQQQGDVLEQKDKEIKELKLEKQALECRLERMERRMSLLKQKEESLEPETEVQNGVPLTPKTHDKGIKRKSISQLNSPTPTKIKSAARKLARTPTTPRIRTVKKHVEESDTTVKETPSDNTPKLASRVVEEEKTHLQTDHIYYVCDSELRSRHIEIFRPEDAQILRCSDTDRIELEVPSWRFIKYTNLYQMEGTENLEDEMIIKRHSKPELEEKRRKRWDMQRMREQRAAKKLHGKDTPLRCETLETANDVDSFLPILDEITHIEVTEKLPVLAFGHPLPSLTPQEFELPWDCDKGTWESNQTVLSKRHVVTPHTTPRGRRK